MCCAALNTVIPATAQIATGGTYSLEQSVVANGGGSSSGTGYAIDGTSGQFGSGGTYTGGSYGMDGGFWSYFLTAAPGTVSGTVTYANAASPPKYISKVTVTGTGSPTVTTTTAAPGATAGQYMLNGFGTGSYTVTLAKTTGQNGINSFDAARVAQHVSGVSLFTNDNQRASADVTGNGAISSQDAAKIAQFAAGLPFSPPNFSGTWRFFLPPGPTFPIGSSPTSRSYPSISGNIAGDDYVGLLIGEVTGNWAPSSLRLNRPGPDINKDIDVAAPALSTPASEAVVIPLNVKGATKKGVISYEFNLRYDPSVIQPQTNPIDLEGTVSQNLMAVANPTVPGLLRVVIYGSMPIAENGVLLNLKFSAVGAVGSVSPLVFERIMFNEGEPQVSATDGQVMLSAATSN